MGLLLVSVPSWVQGALPQVLHEMPTAAAVVVVTAPLTTLNSKADVFARQVGLPVAPEQPINLAEMLGAQFGIGGMLDGTRGVGLAIMDLKNVEKTLIAFVPVVDASQTIQALGAQQDVNNPGTWMLPNKEMWLKPAGNRLLVAGNPQSLAGIDQMPKGIKLNASDERLFSNSEVAAMVKLAPVMPEVREKLTAVMTNEPKMQEYPALASVLNKGINRLCELDSLAIGAGLSANGIKLNLNLQAQPNSVLAKHLVGHPTADISALSRLPAGDYVMAYTFSADPKLIYVPIAAVLETWANDPSMTGKINASDLAELKNTLRQFYETGSKGAEAMYASPTAAGTPPAGAGAIPNISAISTVDDMGKILSLTQKICPLASRITQQAGYPVLINYKSQAGVVNGLNYDEISIDISQLPLPPEVIQAMTMQAAGQKSFTYQVCKIDQKRLASGMGSTGLQGAVDAAQKSAAGLDKDPQIIKTAQELSSKANVLAFVNISKYFQWALSMQTAAAGEAAQTNPMMPMIMGMCSQIQGTAAMSMTFAEGQLATELFIPAETIQSAVAMFMQMQMMMTQPPPGTEQSPQAQPEPTF